jgi:hypothetical protein
MIFLPTGESVQGELLLSPRGDALLPHFLSTCKKSTPSPNFHYPTPAKQNKACPPIKTTAHRQIKMSNDDAWLLRCLALYDKWKPGKLFSLIPAIAPSFNFLQL